MKFFQKQYRIVPTFDASNKNNGYTIIERDLLGCWNYMQAIVATSPGEFKQQNAWFKTYAEAEDFFKTSTKIITNETVSVN